MAITSLSTISYVPLFAPNHYSEPGTYGGVPMPQLSITGNSIDIGFTTYNEEIPQFTFDGEGGTAVFAYSAAPVPEPRTGYKRREAPIGLRVTHRSFGKDWRYPITNKFRQ